MDSLRSWATEAELEAARASGQSVLDGSAFVHRRQALELSAADLGPPEDWAAAKAAADAACLARNLRQEIASAPRLRRKPL